MGEFKFNCPGCDQKIGADDLHRGLQIACPTWNAPIVVPKAVLPPPIPQIAKPAIPTTTAVAAPRWPPRPQPVPDFRPGIASLVCSLSSLLICVGWLPGIICGHLARARIRRDPSLQGSGLAKWGLITGYTMLVLTVGGSAAWFMFVANTYKQVFQEAQQAEAANTKAVTHAKPDAGTVADQPIVPDKSQWTMDVKSAEVPRYPVRGKLHGLAFFSQKTAFKNGDLKFTALAGSTLTIHGLGVSIENLSFDSRPPPATMLRRSRSLGRKTEITRPKLESGYAMKLKTDAAVKRRVHGQLYLCRPDDSKSFVAGTFTIVLPKPKP